MTELKALILDTETHTLNGYPIEIAFAPCAFAQGVLVIHQDQVFDEYFSCPEPIYPGEIETNDRLLLEYRRQHNIFERNDYVVNRDIKYSDELNIVSSSNDKALWFFGKIYGGFVKSQFRHATDAEIKAGKRLEVS